MLWALVSRHNASCFFKLHDGLSMLTTKYRSCLIAVTSKGELLHMLRYFDTYLRFACMWKVDHCWAWPYMAVDPPAATGNYTVSGGALGWALSPARVSSLLHHRWHQDPEGNLVDRARVRVIAVKGPLSAAYFHDSYFQLGGCDDPPQWQSACECLYSHAACCLWQDVLQWNRATSVESKRWTGRRLASWVRFIQSFWQTELGRLLGSTGTATCMRTTHLDLQCLCFNRRALWAVTQVPVDHLMFNLTITNIPWDMVLHKWKERVQTLMRLVGVKPLSLIFFGQPRLFTFMCPCLLNGGSEGFSLGTRGGRKHSRRPNASTLRITPY